MTTRTRSTPVEARRKAAERLRAQEDERRKATEEATVGVILAVDAVAEAQEMLAEADRDVRKHVAALAGLGKSMEEVADLTGLTVTQARSYRRPAGEGDDEDGPVETPTPAADKPARPARGRAARGGAGGAQVEGGAGTEGGAPAAVTAPAGEGSPEGEQQEEQQPAA